MVTKHKNVLTVLIRKIKTVSRQLYCKKRQIINYMRKYIYSSEGTDSKVWLHQVLARTQNKGDSCVLLVGGA